MNTAAPEAGSRGTLAVLGAGKIGTTLARMAVRAGWEVRLTGSSNQPMQAIITQTLAPGAELMSEPEAIAGADLVVVAVPLGKSGTIGWDALDGQVVVDAMNHWEPVDGPLTEPARDSTSAMIAARNPRMLLVKSLNQLPYDELEADARPAGSPARRGIVISTDDAAAALVARLIDDIGYDPVVAPASAGLLLEPGGPVFGRRLTQDQLSDILAGHPGAGGVLP